MTTGTMKWKTGPGGVSLDESDILAAAPAADDLLPVFDTSAGEGKAVAKSWADQPRFLTKPTTANLSVADMCDTVISNLGMTDADAALTLPTCGPGMRARFTVATARAKKWGVRAGSADKIYLIAIDNTVAAGADNGYARFTNAVLGQCMDVWSFESASGEYDWMVKAVCIATSALAAN
jgi:hypothetical protein